MNNRLKHLGTEILQSKDTELTLGPLCPELLRILPSPVSGRVPAFGYRVQGGGRGTGIISRDKLRFTRGISSPSGYVIRNHPAWLLLRGWGAFHKAGLGSWRSPLRNGDSGSHTFRSLLRHESVSWLVLVCPLCACLALSICSPFLCMFSHIYFVYMCIFS